MDLEFDFQKITELVGSGSNFDEREVKSYLRDFNLKYWLNIKKYSDNQHEWNAFMNSRFVTTYPPTEEGFVKYYLRIKSRKINFLS